MNDIQKSTRDKILTVAGVLFANNGYDGTSIREIAKQADVNLASINYHFQNKQNLYCEVFEQHYTWLAEGINHIGEEENLDVKNFSLKIFDFFLENGHALLNSFKILLNDNVPIPENFHDGKELGPPGGEVLLEKLAKEVGENVSPEALEWGMTSIFTHLVHKALMMSSSIVQKKCDVIPSMGPELKEVYITMLVDAIVEYIKNNPQKMKNLTALRIS